MIKVTVLYPYSEDAKFDLDYYTNTHLPMLLSALGPVCKGVSIDKGISSAQPGSNPPYVYFVHMLFDSAEAFFGAFMPHAETIFADLPNYTNINATMQISEVIPVAGV